MTVLVIAEHQGQQLKQSTYHAVTAASQIAPEVSLLIAGHLCADLVEQAKMIEHVSTVIVADNKVYQHGLPERLAPLIREHAQSYSHILAPATTFGKNIMPRLAALLDVGQISDINQIIDSSTFKRPIYAGNAIATVKSLDHQHVITIRTTAFEPAKATKKKAEIIASTYVSNNDQSQYLDEKTHASDQPELSSADIVISGGRGLKNSENFSRLRYIADQMQAAVGASRAAVDANLAPNDCQIGQTGQIVAPKLYIAVGISGAIQHVAGIKDSKTIVAINNDANAPIFQIADYGLIADIDDILPQWEEKLKNENWNS